LLTDFYDRTLLTSANGFLTQLAELPSEEQESVTVAAVPACAYKIVFPLISDVYIANLKTYYTSTTEFSLGSVATRRAAILGGEAAFQPTLFGAYTHFALPIRRTHRCRRVFHPLRWRTFLVRHLSVTEFD
jgi:hypothetical protein